MTGLKTSKSFWNPSIFLWRVFPRVTQVLLVGFISLGSFWWIRHRQNNSNVLGVIQLQPDRETEKLITATGAGAKVEFYTLEAENPINETSGTRIAMTSLPGGDTSTPELEASGRSFVSLTTEGEFLEFGNVPQANTLVIRHCIPDALSGGGKSATLNLYVNGVFRQSVTLESRHNWLYGKAGSNGQSNNPADGAPHHFWADTHLKIEGELKAGDTLRLQKDAGNEAAFYHIDCIDLENVAQPNPAPVGSLSVTDFGASGTDLEDDTKAIANCIAAAQQTKKTVWIPPGTYYQSTLFQVSGITVQGAGMWHTRIVGTTEGKTFAGDLGFSLTGSGVRVCDLMLESNAHTRRSKGGKAFTSSRNCTDWQVKNVWIQHTNVGFWMSNAHQGRIVGCRVRNTYADAINLNNGSSHILVENCHVRGAGDDGVAILSEKKVEALTTNIVVRKNTVVANWWGQNCDLAGGTGHLIEENHFADSGQFACLTINLPGAYPMHPLSDSALRRNIILRGGGNAHGQRRGAVWTFADSAPVNNVTFTENVIVNPLFRAFHLAGSQKQNLTFAGNQISMPGDTGFFIQRNVSGEGHFSGNIIIGLQTGKVPVENLSQGFQVHSAKNSWAD